MAGALAEASRRIVRCRRSIVPLAVARSGPAATARSTRSAARGAGEARRQRERAEVGQADELRERPVRRLGSRDLRPDAGGADVSRERITAGAVEPTGREIDPSLLQGSETQSARHSERDGTAGHGEGEIEPADAKPVDDDAECKVGPAGAARETQDRDMIGGKLLDFHRTGQQCQRRPCDLETVDPHPGAASVADLDPGRPHLSGQATVEARDRDLAAREPRREPLDQTAARRGVDAEEQQRRHQDQPRERDADCPGGDPCCAPHQKASPNPI
jgi:hypothetical protein